MPAPDAPVEAPASNLPIDTISASDGGGTPDFMSAIDKAFDAAEKGESPTDNPEAPKTPETPATETPEKPVTETPTKVTSPKAADFAKIKTERDQVKGELEKAQAAFKELETKHSTVAAELAEVTALREKVAAYEKEVSAVRVEASPEYARVVTEPANRIRQEAERLATKYKLDRNAVIDALAEADISAQGDKASELASSMNQRDQFQFYQLMDDFNAVIAKRGELQSKSQEVWQEIQQTRDKQTATEKEASKKAWKSAEEEVWGAIEKRVPDMAKLPNIQAIRDQVVAKPITELTAKEQAYSSVAGLLFPHVVKQKTALEAKVKELETSLAKFKQATPGAGGGSTVETASDSDSSLGGFLDNIERRIQGGV